MALDGVTVAVGEDPTVVDVAETVVEKETLPEKRLNVSTVTVELADWLARMFRLLGLALRPKSAAVFEILQAVRGCSSHPEKLWAASVRWSGSQKTNPCTSISGPDQPIRFLRFHPDCKMMNLTVRR